MLLLILTVSLLLLVVVVHLRRRRRGRLNTHNTHAQQQRRPLASSQQEQQPTARTAADVCVDTTAWGRHGPHHGGDGQDNASDEGKEDAGYSDGGRLRQRRPLRGSVLLVSTPWNFIKEVPATADAVMVVRDSCADETRAVEALVVAAGGAHDLRRHLRRCLRASSGSETAALKLSKKLLERQMKKGGDAEEVCEDCLAAERRGFRVGAEAHRMFCVGHATCAGNVARATTSAAGWPVIYSAWGKYLGLNSLLQHMRVTAEAAIRAMPVGVEQWIWLSDFENTLPLYTLSPVYSFRTMEILTAAYPERLAHIVIVAAPKLFAAFWRVVKRAAGALYSRDISDKVTVLRHRADLDELLGELRTVLVQKKVGAEMADKLCECVRETRRP